jgi:hypothetical protein
MLDGLGPMTIALVTIAGLAVGVLPACAVLWWFGHRAHRQIVQEAAARHRQWQAEQAERRGQWPLQRQVRDLARAIRRRACPTGSARPSRRSASARSRSHARPGGGWACRRRGTMRDVDLTAEGRNRVASLT